MNYVLAEEVKRRVLAEPAAVNMNYFCELLKVHREDTLCSTVGCIAGHAMMASGMTLKKIKDLELDNMEGVGAALLGISRAEAKQLFYFYSNDKAVDNGDADADSLPYLQFARRLRKQRAGSKRYAKIVADAIDFCVYRHRNWLELTDVTQ